MRMMLKKWKKRLELRKLMLIEILETLISICEVVAYDTRHVMGGKYLSILFDHAYTLKLYSEELKVEVEHDKK